MTKTLDNKENEMVTSSIADSSMTPDDRRPSHEVKRASQAKQEKAVAHDLEVASKEFRAKMSDQLKCLGERTEVQVASLSELQDYFRRRGEIEAEYAGKLEKLSKSIVQKHKAEKLRREAWPQHTTSTVWQTLVDQTKDEAKKRHALSELYGKQVTSSIESRCDDLGKISKRCREIGSYSHNELNRVLSELQTAMKTYQLCYAEVCGVERKKRSAEEDVRRYEEANAGKSDSRKYRSLVKYFKKRDEKYEAVRMKCTKARNEYLLCVKAANAALHRFFAQDLSYIIDCMDLGMDFWLRALLEQVIDERKRLTQNEMDSLAELGTLRSAVDAKADKQKFFEANHQLFMLPKQFEFRPQLGDEISEVSAEQNLSADLLQRQRQIEKRLEGLRFETDEVWKSLEACEKQILTLYTVGMGEDVGKWRNDLLVTYQYYMKKFEFFLLNGNLMERLEARSGAIGEALAKQGVSILHTTSSSDEHRNGSYPMTRNGSGILEEKRKKIKRIGVSGDGDHRPRPKLFGGSLDEYVEATGESIPLLVESAVRYLSRYSLRNQGLFRISGSQSEINKFKESYERGDDVFSYLRDSSESNSVAGVLKLYFRELREPIFPIFLFEQFCDCAKAESAADFIRRTRELISKLPISHVLLLRFLFQFLSHLCEFADENMMEPHNMAICFGPTLLPIPEGKDQVFYHNYVNELVRNLIIHADEVFPRDIPGPTYDKYALQHVEDDQQAYFEDNELVSEDDDVGCHAERVMASHDMRNHNKASSMLDSTYESADHLTSSSSQTHRTTNSQSHNAAIMSPRVQKGMDSQQPSVSSRSSNRSTASEDINTHQQMLKTDMPHRIANELNSIFKNSSMNDAAGGKGISVLRHSNADFLWDNERTRDDGTLSRGVEDRDYASPPALLSTQLQHQIPSCSFLSERPHSISQDDYQEVCDSPTSSRDSARRDNGMRMESRESRETPIYTPIQPRAASVQNTNSTSTTMTRKASGGVDGSSVSIATIAGTTAASAAQGVRMIGKSSLRDQLLLMRGTDPAKMATSESTFSNSSSSSKRSEETTVLDARVTTNGGSLDTSSGHTSVDEMEAANPLRTETSQPDIVNSARRRPASPTLDDIVAALNEVTQLNQ